jgi:osmotically inducible lipoprotein OsmB
MSRAFRQTIDVARVVGVFVGIENIDNGIFADSDNHSVRRLRAAKLVQIRTELLDPAAEIAPAPRGQLWRAPPGRSLRRRGVTLGAGTGSGVHEAMDRAQARAFSLSMMPGNRRRSSMAAESSPCSSKMARIAAASASVTTNISAGWEGASRRASKPFAKSSPHRHAHKSDAAMQDYHSACMGPSADDEAGHLARRRWRIPMRSIVATSLVVATLTFGLAACGYSPGDRAASGGLIGAGGGAAIAAIAGGNPLVGATIGGAAGAIGGAVTSGNSINLGRPVWR